MFNNLIAYAFNELVSRGFVDLNWKLNEHKEPAGSHVCLLAGRPSTINYQILYSGREISINVKWNTNDKKDGECRLLFYVELEKGKHVLIPLKHVSMVKYCSVKARSELLALDSCAPVGGVTFKRKLRTQNTG